MHNHYLNFSELSSSQIAQYREAFITAFPQIILESEIVLSCWEKVEKYFPTYQCILISEKNDIIGFINTLPFFWDAPLDHLPDEGWDWLMNKGISDFDKGIQPNSLGGLQVIVRPNYLGQGISKTLIKKGRELQEQNGYQNFAIPIRPTFKHKYPKMQMTEYLRMKKDGKIYDPWIRTHLNSGAEIVKVCANSMNVKGPLKFWRGLIDQPIHESGQYRVDGALNLVRIDIENNVGEYREDNIWINYSR